MRALLMAPLLLLGLPGAAAGLPASSCDNHGAHVMVGIGNSYACTPDDGSCVNRGIVLMAGPYNSYDCVEGSCENDGVVVNVGGSFCGGGPVEACVDDACWSRMTACGATSTAPCVDVDTQGIAACAECLPLPCRAAGDPRTVVSCGAPGVACALAAEPLCWSFRLACAFARGPLEFVTDNRTSCEPQPGMGPGQGVDYAGQIGPWG